MVVWYPDYFSRSRSSLLYIPAALADSIQILSSITRYSLTLSGKLTSISSRTPFASSYLILSLIFDLCLETSKPDFVFLLFRAPFPISLPQHRPADLVGPELCFAHDPEASDRKSTL